VFLCSPCILYKAEKECEFCLLADPHSSHRAQPTNGILDLASSEFRIKSPYIGTPYKFFIWNSVFKFPRIHVLFHRCIYNRQIFLIFPLFELAHGYKFYLVQKSLIECLTGKRRIRITWLLAEVWKLAWHLLQITENLQQLMHYD